MKLRSAPNADAPGAYQLATRIGKSVIDPGEKLEFEQYITGYGNILTPKLQAYISTDNFDLPNSRILHSLKSDFFDGGFIFSWGNDTANITPTGFTCLMAGIQNSDDDPSTMIFDYEIGVGDPRLACELKLGHAPFEYSLQTIKEMKPGEYYIDFYLTYFNGEKWQCSKERLPFKVRNFFERNAKLISWLAIIASSLGVLRFTIWPLILHIMNSGY